MSAPKPSESEKSRNARYESDRRGEHAYPHEKEDDRPSQRERDALKERLERQSPGNTDSPDN